MIDLMSMGIYLVMGLCFTTYWWVCGGWREQYLEAKKSKEGVEEGMAVLTLMLMVWFWPLKLIRDVFRKLSNFK